MNIIVLSSLVWDFLWQRPQHITSKLAKKGHNIVFVNLPIYSSPSLLLKKLRQKRVIEIKKVQDNIWVVQLYLPEFRGTFSRVKDGFLRFVFKSALKKIGFRPDVAIFYSLHFVPLIDVLKSLKSKIAFDCVDDIISFSEFKEPKFIKQEIELIKASDICFATSLLLCEKIEKYNRKCTYLPNAMDFDHFNAVTKPGMVNVEPEVLGLRHPVIGFIGAIYDWIDTDLICKVADAYPDYTILLVGPVSFGKEKFETRSNIKMVGTKPYASLPSFLADFDVCMIPFKLNDITLAANPIKMYEYLAGGKPVVSTALPEIIRNGVGVVDVAVDHEDFIKKIGQAVLNATDKAAAYERVAFAKKNSWESRVDVMNQLLKEVAAL